MEPKYYTPEIEEFHVGFEFFLMLGGVHQRTFLYEDEAKDFFANYKKEDCLVKHLDREDIESLGFLPSGNTAGWTFKNEGDMASRIMYFKIVLFPRGKNIDIYSRYIEDNEDTLIFSGNVKNKSELKKIFIQVGIIND